MPTFIFVVKLPWHFVCIEATSTLHPYWNRDNIYLCHETTSTLHAEAVTTFMKPRRNFICTEIMLTLHLYHWSYVNTSFAEAVTTFMKPHRNFIYTEVMPTFMEPCQHFIFVMKPSQHSIRTCTCIEVIPSFALKPWQHSSMPWSYVNTPFSSKPCQCSFLPWNHDNTSH